MTEKDEKNKDSKKDKKEKFIKWYETLIIVFVFVFMILLIFIIAVGVKNYETLYRKDISLDNWLLYYGTISGTLISGFITAVGLFFTFKTNAKQLEEQREIDNQRWENSNKQFNQQMKIQIINEKIKDYKACNEEIGELIYSKRDLDVEMSKYKSALFKFQVNMHIIQNPKLGPTPEPVKFKKQLDIVIDQHIEFEKLFEKVKLSSKCIYGENIYNNIKKGIDIWSDIQKIYREIFRYTYMEGITDNYSDYMSKDGMIIRELTEFEQLEKMVDEFMDKLSSMSGEFNACVEEIPELICKLYEEKYSIDNICNINNEQKTSNNN